ncbi:MAG: hypothetical protein RIC51_11285 [Erythrobacter sp.]|uniref:hypothetical protein n=1 Tax=Erythrobacter sp. TaxID=1042 RepID=UPI0032F04384
MSIHDTSLHDPSTIERARGILDPDRIVAGLNFTDTIDADQKAIIAEFLIEQADRMKSGLADIEDDEDAAYFLAVKYVECKAGWIQMNLQLNYQTVLKGEKDEFLFNKAAALAGFLGRIEPVVSEDDLGTINEMLLRRMRG